MKPFRMPDNHTRGLMKPFHALKNIRGLIDDRSCSIDDCNHGKFLQHADLRQDPHGLEHYVQRRVF